MTDHEQPPAWEPEPHRQRSSLGRFIVGTGLALVVAATTAAMYWSGLSIPPERPPHPITAPAAPVPTAPVGPVGAGGAASGSAPAGASPSGVELSRLAVSPTDRIDPVWADEVSSATGIPRRALLAYASADLIVDAEQPGCGIGWNTLAGIGAIESGHGSHGGAVLRDDGYASPAIVGVPLNGDGVAAIADTDGGRWDGDAVWDRAVGPLQFIPSTWSIWAADGNGDGVSDPNQIDDATLAAARYLCASGSMAAPEGWRAAVFSYNHLDAYVDGVAAAANGYADAVRGIR